MKTAAFPITGRASPETIAAAARREVDVDTLLEARNKIVTAHLAISGLADKCPDYEDEILCIERVLDDGLRDLYSGLKLGPEEAAA